MFPVSPQLTRFVSPCHRFPCIQEYIFFGGIRFPQSVPGTSQEKRVSVPPRRNISYSRRRVVSAGLEPAPPTAETPPRSTLSYKTIVFRFPFQQEQYYLFFILKSNPKLCVSKKFLKMFSGGIPTHTRNDLTSTGYSRLIRYLLRHG